MNKFLLFTLLLVGSVGAFAQNKTLGVGTATPNPNAVLHLESPTNNQGFLLPRMTTAQRTAFTGSLSTTDLGLMVYDTDMKDVLIWQGSSWNEGGGDPSVSATITTTTGNAGYFAINNPANTGAALYATTNGSGGSTSAAIEAVTGTAFSAITARGTGGAANALTGIISDPGPGGYAVLGTVSATGGGQAGVFNIFNASNANNALEVTTSGTGGAGFFKVANAASTKPALWVETNSNQPLTTPIYGLNTGTGDAAGVFRINNAGSNKQAVFAETNGSGSSVHGVNLGTGNGAYFRKNGSNANSAGVFAENYGTDGYAGIFQNLGTSTKASVYAEALGTGPSIWAFKDAGMSGNGIEATHGGNAGNAGNFSITNAANSASSLSATTNGTGAGIFGQNSGAGNGFAGQFEVTNGTNTFPAIQAKSKGTGSAIRAFQGATDGPGPGMDVFMYNTSSTSPGIMVDQQGLGDGVSFNINRATSTNATIRATTTGTGTAIFANHLGASGNIAIFQSSNANVARIDKNGQGLFNGGTVSSGADVAEMFDIEGARGEYEAGDVLIISESTDRTVEKSNTPNSTKVAGVYATKPGVVLTEKGIEENLDALVPMGVVGVIPTKVCLENGPIKRGDLLVTSSVKGHAMKAISKNNDGIFPAGVIIGKALENFESGERGLIKVLVNVK